MKLTAAVVGLGQIGLDYDYKHDSDDIILTHSSAFHFHPNFELIAGVDNQSKQRKKFQEKYKRATYLSTDEMLVNRKPDVVAVSVPTKYHYQTCLELLNHPLKAIICEKPISDEILEAEEIINKARKNNTILLVNYIRRFEPGVIELKSMLASAKLGNPYKATVKYSKGFYNNGTHFLDLLMFLFGEPKQTKILALDRFWNETDPEPDIQMIFKNGLTSYFISHKEECFSVADVEIYTDRCKIQYFDSGKEIKLFFIEQDELFNEYKSLSKKPVTILTDLQRYQWYTVNALYQHIYQGIRLNSTGDTAIKSIQIAKELLTREVTI